MNIIDIDALILKADELQPLPVSIAKLVPLATGTGTNVTEIARVISMDPMLAARLLRLANSAFTGASVEITSVKEAVSLLGTKRVLSLAIASHARPAMRVEVAAYGYSEGALWRHSVISMLAAEQAAQVCPMPIPAAAATAALLHDIGKLAMAQFLDPAVLNLLNQAQTEGGMSPLESEEEILKVHHGEIGGLIARHWKLPEAIANGITYHHDPDRGNDVTCDVVCL